MTDKNMPPELDLRNLLNAPIFDDATIWDLRIQILRGDIGQNVIKHHGHKPRDPGVDIFHKDGKTPWPDEMTLTEVRKVLVDADEQLIITFRNGGMHQPTRPRTLVPA